jgi:hypothetical protein
MIRSSVPAFLSNLEPEYCSNMLAIRIRDDLLTSIPKLPTFYGDQSQSPGDSDKNKEKIN